MSDEWQGSPELGRQGPPRTLSDPGPLYHLPGHQVLGPFNFSCPVDKLSFPILEEKCQGQQLESSQLYPRVLWSLRKC